MALITMLPPIKTVVKETPHLEDLVKWIYYCTLAHSSTWSRRNELASIMMTRERRGFCLVYDTVTDESTDLLLCDEDLDSISSLDPWIRVCLTRTLWSVASSTLGCGKLTRTSWLHRTIMFRVGKKISHLTCFVMVLAYWERSWRWWLRVLITSLLHLRC